MIQKIKTYILGHKIISIIVLVLLVVGCYFIFRNKASGETQYVTQVVSKGSITTNVTGTGQVEASDTIDLKPKASGDITYVGVKIGQNVKKGILIASVDSRDAKMALLNAQISLAKLTKSPDTLTLLQKQNAVADAYDSGWNTVSTYIDDMTVMVNNLDSIYNGSGYLGYQNTMGLSTTARGKVTQGENSYYDAKGSIDKVTGQYKTLSRSSSKEDISNLINQAYLSSKVMSNTVKNTQTAFNAVVDDLDYSSNSNTSGTRTSISTWLDSSNTYVNSLLSASNNIKESTQSLADTNTGADPLDIQSAQLSVESKQNAYNDTFVYAPFDGVIATLTAKVGEASGTSVGTLITQQKLATISLNEVDIAKIKLGQKVNLTFDAIDGLSITGEVAEIDSIGTVSQGVVSYNVKISFDVNDDRVKPGMSVSATIITDSAQDVIVVPSSAIKTSNGISYVQTFAAPLATPVAGAQGSPSAVPPTQTEVGIGLVGVTSTEIMSGLNEGDIIVTKTVTATTTTAKSTTPSLLNAVGGSRGGGAAGGAFRGGN
jgi:HlyD family secretion protein